MNPLLQNRDITLVIDKSGSMSVRDCANGKSRWEAVKESTIALANELQKYDPDGITVIPFAGSFKVHENTTPSTVESVFAEHRPAGGTVLGPVLQEVFTSYLRRKAAGTAKANGELVLVVTDGTPDDESTVAKAIVAFTKKLDNGDSEFGIQFIQVGQDAHARDFLKRLDDNLTQEGAKFDIVDTMTMDDADNKPLEEILLGALND